MNDPKHILSAKEVEEQLLEQAAKSLAVSTMRHESSSIKTLLQSSEIYMTASELKTVDDWKIEAQKKSPFQVGEIVVCRSSRGAGHLKRLTQGNKYSVISSTESSVFVKNDRDVEDHYSIHHFVKSPETEAEVKSLWDELQDL